MKLVFIDTETTSLDRRRRLIWDLALIVREPRGDLEFQWFLDVDLRHADPASLRIGRYYQRHPDPCRTGRGREEAAGPARPAEVLPFVADLLQGATLAGSVPSFDEETLARQLRQTSGLQPTWGYHILDVVTLAAGRLGLATPWGLDRVSAAAGLPPIPDADRHTALGDARAARDLYDWWAAQPIAAPAVPAAPAAAPIPPRAS